MSIRSPLAALAVAAAAGALAAGPAAAAAGSAIVYVTQDGNVVAVQPSGQNARPLTTDGTTAAPYRRPRLAPDGTVWVLKGHDVVHLGADGQRLSAFTPAAPKDSEGVPSDEEPGWLDVSLDGTRLAYGVDNLRCDGGGCNTDGITTILDTSGKALAEDAHFLEASFSTDARLVGNDGRWEGTVRLMDALAPSFHWYTDGIVVHGGENGVTREPALTPDGSRLAALRTITGVGTKAYTYTVAPGSAAGGLDYPKPLCAFDRTIDTGASPTWAPDGRHLVLAQTDGIVAYDLTAVTGEGTCAKAVASLVGPAGSSQPDWGAIPVSDPPPDDPKPPVTTGTTPTTTTTATTTTPDPPVTRTQVLTVPAQRLKAILRSGLRLRLSGMPAGKTKVVVKAGRTVVGRATLKVPAGGNLRATVKLTRAAARSLARAKRVSFTIRVGALSKTLRARR